jgi:hypothetical protein
MFISFFCGFGRFSVFVLSGIIVKDIVGTRSRKMLWEFFHKYSQLFLGISTTEKNAAPGEGHGAALFSAENGGFPQNI